MSTGEYGYMNTNRRHAVAALIAAGLLWGTTVPLTKLALQWLSPGWLTAARFGLAAAVLLAAAYRRGRGPAQPTAYRRGRGSAQPTALRRAFTPAVLAAGALGYGGSVMVQNAGIIRTSVTHAALLIGAVPVLVAIIAAVWHRTVARPVAWFGFAVSLGGVALVTAGGGGGGATLPGDGLVLLSLLLSATVTVAQARLLTGRDPVAVTAVQFLGAALGSLPIAVVSEGLPAAPAGAGAVLAVAAVAALALAGTLAPFTLFAFGQTRVSAEVAGAFLNLEPLVGAVAGAVVFGDRVGIAQVAGGMAILAGIALSSLPLLAGRRMARRAALVTGAGAAVTTGSGAGAEAGVRTERAGVGVGAGRLGADVPRETKPPSPEPASVKVERRGGRNGVFVVIRPGKFGVGRPDAGQPGAGRPRVAGARHAEAGQAPGRDRGPGRDVRHGRTRPRGRVAGRPPARGRGPGRRSGEPERRPGRRELPKVRA
jgi:O-acetylserine/cysteine efflux transporter